jgi:hypothetical protein
MYCLITGSAVSPQDAAKYLGILAIDGVVDVNKATLQPNLRQFVTFTLWSD